MLNTCAGISIGEVKTNRVEGVAAAGVDECLAYGNVDMELIHLKK